ncbi:hypothetical protein FWH58_00185 [Candidatus Saccharibacteria bacterium]|nr:hypothetical protein [Candidatus Saccharibacteria bacterium]
MGDEPVLDKTKNHKKPQSFIVAANAFSVVYAVQAGAWALILAIQALATGGLSGGTMALEPLQLGISAVAFGVIAFLTASKITDQDMVKKAYGVAKKILLAELVLMASYLVGLVLYALFAVGSDYVSQQTLWLDRFLPLLGLAVVTAGLLMAVKKIKCGMKELLPIMTYIIFGVAGIALLLTIIATFVGLYGHGCTGYYC